MCNDYGNHISYSDYLVAFSQSRIRVKWPAAAPNLEPRDDIWPTDPGPVIRRLEDGTNEFALLRWGFRLRSPKERQLSISDPRGGASRWAAVWFQHRIFSSSPGRSRPNPNGNSSRSTKSGFASPASGDQRLARRELLSPSSRPRPARVAPIHDRQMVILEREDWQTWLDLSKPETELLQPLRAGALRVEQVR